MSYKAYMVGTKEQKGGAVVTLAFIGCDGTLCLSPAAVTELVRELNEAHEAALHDPSARDTVRG